MILLQKKFSLSFRYLIKSMKVNCVKNKARYEATTYWTLHLAKNRMIFEISSVPGENASNCINTVVAVSEKNIYLIRLNAFSSPSIL